MLIGSLGRSICRKTIHFWLASAGVSLLPLSAMAGLDELSFITEEYPPYNYLQEGQLKGLSIDVLEAIFASSGTALQRDTIHYLPWARGYDTALSEPGTVLFSTTRTEQREALFDWVGPIAKDRVTLIARRDSGIQLTDIASLQTSPYRIAVIREDIGAQRLAEASIDAGRLLPALTNLSALNMLERGRVDLWAYSENVAFWLMEQHGLDTREFESVLTLSESELYFAFNKQSDAQLVGHMQQTLDDLRRNGRLTAILGNGITFTTEEYPPFNFMNEDDQIDGLTTRVLRAALADAGLAVTFRLLPWARAYTEARLREDHCVYSTTRTAEREPLFSWVGPLGLNEWSAFVLAESDISATSLTELEGLRMGSFREDAVGQYVAEQGLPVMLSTQERDNIQRLTAGLIDVWVTGDLAARQIATEAEVALRRLFSFKRAELYLACHPSVDDAFLSALQASLDRLAATSGLARIEDELLDALGIAP